MDAPQDFGKFPADFVWGTATSAFQTEGNNTKSDWWAWENSTDSQETKPLDKSGAASDSYDNYEVDLDLCKELNTSAVRLGIEWARIQPEPNRFDTKEIEHYRAVLRAAKARNLKTFVTLYHFTIPTWFAQKGGWLNLQAPMLFAEYARACVLEFKDLIDVYITINEPQVYALMAYTVGTWPPNQRNLLKASIVQLNLIRAHVKAHKEIKKVVNTPVGIAKNIVWFQKSPRSSNILDVLYAKFRFWLNCGFFFDQVIKKCDYIGLNYYFTTQYNNLRVDNEDDFNSDIGWWIYPRGLYNTLLKLKKYSLPIYITENGLANALDEKRSRFIYEMLLQCLLAIKAGVELKGYFYWSLIDNYEWHQGFWPKFGLIEVDRFQNMARVPRPSFYYYSKICQSGNINQ
ncbi:TPA: glycoside hydrolase family 1 protein [candidate division WWE3 bacterium]|uniref:Beta-glucosidase A n=2 Tax=Katanobacteria TaxID=422282 RepID=A0A0G1NFN0_UNCKA|nr:MAG: Beta-glucosidase A [candidate division WWE3 bacterium GW2011_GWC2_44_9]HAZ29585.1 glycoside hydrolase family 1 protein [candidate division WWE3 bacterium]